MEGLREGERMRWGDGSWGRGLENGGVRLRGRVLGKSGEGLREGAIACLEARFREGILGRRHLEARLAFRVEVFSRRFRFFRRCRGGVEAQGIKSRALDVIPPPLVREPLSRLSCVRRSEVNVVAVKWASGLRRWWRQQGRC